jgi:hypothetical protein
MHMPLTITNTSTVFDNEEVLLGAAYRVTAAQVAGTTVAIVTSYGEGGVTVLRFADGVLTPVSTLADTDGTNLSSPLAIHSLATPGGTFVYIGGQENGLSAFRLDSAGTLTLVQDVPDTGIMAT